MSSFFFIFRLLLAWFLVFLVLTGVWTWLPVLGWMDPWPVILLGFVTGVLVLTNALSHLRRVRLIAGRVDRHTLANRQRRQIEIPFEADEAFALVEGAIRDLPHTEEVQSARDSLQVRAKVRRINPYGSREPHPRNPMRLLVDARNQILATIAPGDGSCSVTLICEPESGAWSDWFRVDDATNLETAEALTRAITRRVTERRRREQAASAQTGVEKELAVARLNLLHAQVEPHFLYNTLASAQYLARNDPLRAEEMLGHLIQYLRHSLPRAEESLSTLGVELERARAYLEILRIRMGQRLQVQIDVPNALLATPLPPMMLQTLVENAIKHGLEPKPGGGIIWILTRSEDDRVAITVADDGQGLDSGSGGTGIGLANVRERLRLVFGPAAALTVAANFPSGVAATITVPAAAAASSAHDASTYAPEQGNA